MKKVSIIIPVYNSEKFLKRCLDSVVNQTYQNLEIIIVNDGSSDSSKDICTSYQNKDNRIILVNKPNEGVGASRNLGIEISTGDYILFLDSDDSLDLEYVETLMQSAFEYNSDVTESGARVHLENDVCIYPYQKEDQINCFEKKEFIRRFLLFQTNISVWGKLYKRELIGDTRFNKMNINEDFFFTWEINKKVNLYLENLNINCNYYLDKPNSLSKAPFSINNMTMMNYIDKLYNESTSMYPEFEKEAKSHYSACLLHNLFLYYFYLEANNSNLYLDCYKKMVEYADRSGEIMANLLLSECGISVFEMLDKINTLLKEKENEVNRYNMELCKSKGQRTN